MTNIQDVAKLAKVAPITVSRVINNSGYVSDKTRKRVEGAIAELGYVPNMLGPSLRFKQTMSIAAMVTDITNPFWTTVTRGIEDVASANGYLTILCNSDESEEKQALYLETLLQRQIDGILLVPASNDSASIKRILNQKIPLVVLDREVQNVAVDVVRADSQEGAYLLTKHLLALGHRHIAMLAGPKSTSTSVDRVTGYLHALEEAGIEPNDDLIYWDAYTQEAGYRNAKRVINSALCPTAIFAANNFIAIGTIQALKDQELCVPDDMSIVAVDDIPPTYSLEPFLTVAAQPAKEMGRVAAELLLDRIKNEEDKPPQSIILDITMIIRSSSGKNLKR
ncbi:MAG: LacI family transcriptional regulator [Chloroflexi bacterium]|nr:LacI family transcriptional regulator [Chloroflexota bacterium]